MPGLLVAMGFPLYDLNEWRLFIDSSKKGLKCVLLHNGNLFGAIPIGRSVHLKEKHEQIKLVLDLLNYEGHKWIICGNLKIVNLSIEQQGGYTKCPCLLCLLDSRAKDKHWEQKL